MTALRVARATRTCRGDGPWAAQPMARAATAQLSAAPIRAHRVSYFKIDDVVLRAIFGFSDQSR